MLKKSFQQDRSERRGRSPRTLRYVEPLSDARTTPADCFSTLSAVSPRNVSASPLNQRRPPNLTRGILYFPDGPFLVLRNWRQSPQWSVRHCC